MSDAMLVCGTEKLSPQRGEMTLGNGYVRDTDGGSGNCSLNSTSPPSLYTPVSTPSGSCSPVSASPTIRKKGLNHALSSGHISISSVRQRLNHIASSPTFSRHIGSSPTGSRPSSPLASQHQEIPRPAGFVGWYVTFFMNFIRHIVSTVTNLTWSQLILLGPTLWLSAWLWIFWKSVQLPLTLIKWLLTVLHTPASERGRKKRTVLISGGSTIQALHLARNFYSAGARVVVFEIEGLFGLARFSTAVHKFYTVPRPAADHPQKYVKALCDIVERENASYFIPVSATSTAYYDALAKPHLELLGCSCFCPGVKDVWLLDDILEVLQHCQGVGIPTPLHYAVTSRDEVLKLYDSGLLRTGRHVMVSVGPWGCRYKQKIVMPAHRHEFKAPHEISEQKPWVVIQDVPGQLFLTCTTVKESQVVANVTCQVNKDSGGLVPVENQEIAGWLKNFFSRVRPLRQVTGHVSFRFVVSDADKTLVPMSCRVGVSMPYICYTSVHPRIVWKPCKHFSRQNSGPLVADTGRYWMHEAVMNTLKHPSVEAVGRLIGTVLDKREALFVFWDPLPYCAYYHIQLPFKNVLAFVQEHYGRNGRNGFQYKTMAAPVH